MFFTTEASRTVLGSVYERFIESAPVAVMARAIIERCLAPENIDQVFRQAAERQYNRDLLFSTVFAVMSETVCNLHRSVGAAYQARQPPGGPSAVALYDKLKGTEPGVVAALVGHTARELEPVVRQTGGLMPSPLPGMPVRILDGSCIAATQRRPKVLRQVKDEALPGKAMVVLDPELMLILEMIPCEDGHAQERALIPQVLARVRAGELWIGDRNLCTHGWVEGVEDRRAYFIVRQHACFGLKPLGEFRPVGRNESGRVSEQKIKVVLSHGQVRHWRRIRVQLDQPTRNGDQEIFLLTNLQRGRAGARKIAQLYLGRWTIERMFQEIEATLNCEINTLAYPKAALLGLCVGLVAHNVLAVVKAAMRAVHSVQTVAEQISGYYLAEELEGTYRGLEIALPARTWARFRQMTSKEMAEELLRIARRMHLCRYQKHSRGPKKPPPPRKRLGGRWPRTHVSTARLLAAK